MPTIYDNLEEPLAPALAHEVRRGLRADFCVGYFNLRGWALLADAVDAMTTTTDACRVLVGMHRSPRELVRAVHGFHGEARVDVSAAKLLERRAVEDFRAQLVTGLPTRADERTLRLLSAQLRSGRVRVRLHLREALHAQQRRCGLDLRVVSTGRDMLVELTAAGVR